MFKANTGLIPNSSKLIGFGDEKYSWQSATKFYVHMNFNLSHSE